MPKIETIKATDAPLPPEKMSKISPEIVRAIKALKKDEALRLEPDPERACEGRKPHVADSPRTII